MRAKAVGGGVLAMGVLVLMGAGPAVALEPQPVLKTYGRVKAYALSVSGITNTTYDQYLPQVGVELRRVKGNSTQTHSSPAVSDAGDVAFGVVTGGHSWVLVRRPDRTTFLKDVGPTTDNLPPQVSWDRRRRPTVVRLTGPVQARVVEISRADFFLNGFRLLGKRSAGTARTIQ
jgi:hypothetical protein